MVFPLALYLLTTITELTMSTTRDKMMQLMPDKIMYDRITYHCQAKPQFQLDWAELTLMSN